MILGESNPCLNDGVCQDHDSSYICKCLPGYSGKTCQISKTPSSMYYDC